jgi:hypothetical protein
MGNRSKDVKKKKRTAAGRWLLKLKPDEVVTDESVTLSCTERGRR